MGTRDQGLTRIDDRLGDALENAIQRHHRRRLAKYGWADALEVEHGRWWSPRTPVHEGNTVRVLIDGHEAFPEMEQAIRAAEVSVHIAGWHSSPDFRLTSGPNAPTLGELLAEKAETIPVRVLMWGGPPMPMFKPTRKDAREACAGFTEGTQVQCALDTRERTMHCHHEKLVIIDGRLAFVGGIDFTALDGDRLDGQPHLAEESMGWHDVASVIEGPAVRDVAAHFIDRWNAVTEQHLPPPLLPAPTGRSDVQILRTVPERTYPFLPSGEFSILQAYLSALGSAQEFIYLENQFLWSPEVADVLIEKLQHPPRDDFRIVVLLPAHPTNGKDTTQGQLARLIEADDDAGRLLATTRIGSTADGPSVYVHAKVGIIDDRWLTIGSANLNEHSLFNDTEMNMLTDDTELARDTRLRLWSEHLEKPVAELAGPATKVIDELWKPIAKEQGELSKAGLDPKHRIRGLDGLSRRIARLQGPLRGILVDG